MAKSKFKKIVVAVLIAILLVIYFVFSYRPISGAVVDAETGKPIEGAVVLVEWTRTRGIGLTSTTSYKVAEVVTDAEGQFRLPGVLNPFVNAPDLTIYKKGYVAWSNRWIFPRYENRTDFRWGKGYVFKLEKFKDTYSYTDHQMFTTLSINSTIGQESKQLFMKIYDDSEREKVIMEQNKKDLERMRGPRP